MIEEDSDVQEPSPSNFEYYRPASGPASLVQSDLTPMAEPRFDAIPYPSSGTAEERDLQSAVIASANAYKPDVRKLAHKIFALNPYTSSLCSGRLSAGGSPRVPDPRSPRTSLIQIRLRHRQRVRGETSNLFFQANKFKFPASSFYCGGAGSLIGQLSGFFFFSVH